ncbi:hypothetical protein UY3_18610, partial [Chelonia mydas]
HPAPNSLVVDAVKQKKKHQFPRSTPSDKDSRQLDLLGRKVYASSTLQFRIATYSAVLAKYDHKNYNKFMDFIDHIPEDKKQQITAIVSEGQILSRTALQAALDVANIAARSTATAVVMRRGSWLSSSSFPRKFQSTIEDLPFDGDKLFASTTNDVLHSMKDSRATLQSLGIQTPLTRRRDYRYQPYQRPRYPTYTQQFHRSHEQQQP